MRRKISSVDFDHYKRLVCLRWKRFEAHRIVLDHEYETNRRWAKLLDVIIVIAALVTALFAALQSFPWGNGWADAGTVFAGVVTGLIPTMREVFKWDGKASEHKKNANLAMTAIMDLQAWLETLSRGWLTDKDELMIGQSDSIYRSLIDADVRVPERTKQQADRTVNAEIENFQFLSSAPQAAEDQDVDAPDEIDVAGFERMVRPV